MQRFLSIFTLLLLFASIAFAKPSANSYNTSVTTSPFRLFNPELFVTGELQLAPKIGVAASLGAGQVTDEDQTYGIFEAANQWRYYLLGNFCKGLIVGVEAGYVGVSGGQMPNATMYLVGLHLGGFLGYKITLKRGFTTEALLGPVYVFGKTKATSELQTLIHFNVGWSFQK